MGFGDFFKKLADVLMGIEPLLETAANLAFPGSGIAVAAVKYGVQAIGDAEKAYGGGNGPLKLAYVNKASKDFVAGFKAAGGDITVNGQEIDIEPLMTQVTNSIIAGTKAVGVQYDETPVLEGAKELGLTLGGGIVGWMAKPTGSPS